MDLGWLVLNEGGFWIREDPEEDAGESGGGG